MAEWRLPRRFGFKTITDAQKGRDNRKSAIADGRLFPEQERAQRAAVLFKDYGDGFGSAYEQPV